MGVMGEHERCWVSQGHPECREDWDLLKGKATVVGGGQVSSPPRTTLPADYRPTLPARGVANRHQASGG